MNERADGHENNGGEKLWGIYHADAEYSRQLGEPVRTVVTAVTKTAADEAQRKHVGPNGCHNRAQVTGRIVAR